LSVGRHTSIIRSSRGIPNIYIGSMPPLAGSAIAQQIINKNNEAWRSFLKLKKLEKLGRLPEHIKRVSMPRYWKKNGRRERLLFLLRVWNLYSFFSWTYYY